MTSRPISHKIDDPLYNSRLLKNYAEYIEKFHPEILEKVWWLFEIPEEIVKTFCIAWQYQKNWI